MNQEVKVMLGWVLALLAIALIAGVVASGGITGASVQIVKAIFFVAVVLFLLSVILSGHRRRPSA
jgi:uncharacterized membrane protein YtjA (UPF0391 family)